MQVDAQLSEQVELVRLVDSDGLTLLHWAADRGQVPKCIDQSKLVSFQTMFLRLKWQCFC